MQRKRPPLFATRRGSLTVQFLLGFILILSFVMLFATMTLTLAVSEITQYITYSASRALFLSAENEVKQKESAQAKYNELTAEPAFQELFKDTMFKINKPGQMGLNNDGPEGFSVNSGSPNLFYGVWTEFTPKVLMVDSLWGSTEKDEGKLKTNIGSYLGREPTVDECKNFNDKRWQLDLSPASCHTVT